MAKTRSPKNRGQMELAPGVMRFSRARLNYKKALHKKKPFKSAKKTHKCEDNFTVKKVGGSKNGGERKVLKVRPARRMQEFREPSHKCDQCPAGHKRKTMANHGVRKSLTPGTVCILLAGRHKGKRVVFLKQLAKSGCLLVTGPMKLNNVPMRRIPASYVIATKTKLDVSKLTLPEHITDDYFKRAAKPKRKMAEGEDIFAPTKVEYEVSQQRKDDQKKVDSALLTIIRSDKANKKTLFGYLGSKWSLRKTDAPHKMVF